MQWGGGGGVQFRLLQCYEDVQSNIISIRMGGRRENFQKKCYMTLEWYLRDTTCLLEFVDVFGQVDDHQFCVLQRHLADKLVLTTLDLQSLF